jgi:hypothetical protein
MSDEPKLTEKELNALRWVAEHGTNPSKYVIRLLNEHAELTTEVEELRVQLTDIRECAEDKP